jgi:hypothetical protein
MVDGPATKVLISICVSASEDSLEEAARPIRVIVIRTGCDEAKILSEQWYPSATMATSQASGQRLHAASCRTIPANKMAKDNPHHFDRANNGFPETPPKSSTQGKLKAPETRTTAASTTHYAAWSDQTSGASMSHSRKTY